MKAIALKIINWFFVVHMGWHLILLFIGIHTHNIFGYVMGIISLIFLIKHFINKDHYE